MTESGKQDQEASRPSGQNKRLRDELKAIQRQVNEQEGQLKVLLTFVQTALHEQVDSRAERAAVRAVERMISFRGERQPEIE